MSEEQPESLDGAPTSHLLKELCKRFDAFICIGNYVDEDNKENLEFCFHGTLTSCIGLAERAKDNLFWEAETEDTGDMDDEEDEDGEG